MLPLFSQKVGRYPICSPTNLWKVLHRDGVTCAHVVRTIGVAHGGDPPQQHQPGASAAAGATGAAVSVSAAGEERGNLTLCASSKDGSLKIFALEREVKCSVLCMCVRMCGCVLAARFSTECTRIKLSLAVLGRPCLS